MDFIIYICNWRVWDFLKYSGLAVFYCGRMFLGRICRFHQLYTRSSGRLWFLSFAGLQFSSLLPTGVLFNF
jgi:hypothetical protein